MATFHKREDVLMQKMITLKDKIKFLTIETK